MPHVAELGDRSIFMVRDGEPVSVPRSELFAATEADAFVSEPVNETLALSFNCYVVRDRSGTTLIDCGIGNQKRRAYPGYDMRTSRFLDDLSLGGVAPDRIDRVIFTHLHPDHVGWSTIPSREGWSPTFRNARYIMSRTEYARLEQRSRSPRSDGWLIETFRDSLLPLMEAGQIELVATGADLGDGFSLIPAPGHSCDHALVQIDCGSAVAVALGDLLHHPVQLATPTLNSAYDENPALALSSRKRCLEMLSRSGALVLTAHFLESPWGEIRPREGGGYTLARWQ